VLHHSVGRWLQRQLIVTAIEVLLLQLLVVLQLLLMLQLLDMVVMVRFGPVLRGPVSATAVASTTATRRRRGRRRQYHARNGRRAYYVFGVRHVSVTPPVLLFLLAVHATSGVLRRFHHALQP